jgi:hypothetical protein
MAGFSFFSRFAFICNVFFLISLSIILFVVTDQAEKFGFFAGTAITMGMVIAPILNMGVNIWLIVLLLNKKQITVVKWLTTFNFLVLVLQMIYFMN